LEKRKWSKENQNGAVNLPLLPLPAPRMGKGKCLVKVEQRKPEWGSQPAAFATTRAPHGERQMPGKSGAKKTGMGPITQPLLSHPRPAKGKVKDWEKWGKENLCEAASP